ncbi:hypothetical protein [Achromobacter ruhlandii]|nr:hypothetical protein [Achromobacter ruhlandii]
MASPLLGPDIAQKQYEMAQRQAYAQALLQQGMDPLQGQNVNGHYVAPSWTQGLAKALSSYMGMKAMADMPKQQQELQDLQTQRQAQLFGLGQPSNGNSVAQAFPIGASGQQPTQQPVTGGQPQVPLLPGRSAQESFTIAQGMGLPAYLKLAAEQGFQKPMVVGEGGTVYNPNTRQAEFSAAKNGIQTMYGPNGPVAGMVPGYGAANAAIQGMEAGATEGAKAAFDLVEVPNGSGGKILMPRAQAAAMLGGQNQAPVQSPNPGQQAGAPGALGTTISPQMQEARSALPKIEQQANQLRDVITKTLNHPGLNYSVGVLGNAPTIPGTPQADVRALQDQIQGATFLQAFESLKGGGAITEPEGKKATDAIARLSRAQSPTAYREALQDLMQVLDVGVARAYKSAGMQQPGAQPDKQDMAMPKSAQDYAALPSGAMFRAPDGSIRRKP